MKLLKPNEYQCCHCKNVYTKMRSDEEAMKASIELLGEYPADSYEIMCDDCYKEFYKWYEQSSREIN